MKLIILYKIGIKKTETDDWLSRRYNLNGSDVNSELSVSVEFSGHEHRCTVSSSSALGFECVVPRCNCK